MALDYDDRTDFANAERGFVATLDPVRITNAEGRVIFDLAPYSYLDAKCPDTVHPSLWRQAQLCLTNGLFEVAEGIYQVRGFDLAGANCARSSSAERNRPRSSEISSTGR
jgi:alkyl sulfatase BDS1-like metallo-beta-lactamase superfamily hydrolase